VIRGRRERRRGLPRGVLSTAVPWTVVGLMLAGLLVPALPAAAATTCGASGSHTICITVPDSPLVDSAAITITNTPNTGTVIVTWQPGGGSTQDLITRFGKSPGTDDYSFIWPTHKYLDATGVLRARFGSNGPIAASVTLANGNTSDFQHSPNDWEAYLPGAWVDASDPVVAAVGDGPDDRSTGNAVAASIVAADPPLFLFLGGIYERGTFTENRNMYGVSSLDAPGGGTLWGKLADKTQPTLGNHESPHRVDWRDYWHQRPTYTSFTFGGVLFVDLDSNTSFKPGSAQYTFVQDELATAPDCVVALWHTPILSGDTINTGKRPMWPLLANNGGDLVLNGHLHSMIEYRPLAADLVSDGHMVQLVSGAGGHSLGGGKTGTKVAWSVGKTPGVLYLTLNGAANGGIASSITWRFKKTDGTVLRIGSVTC
jgi:hypothetical protein